MAKRVKYCKKFKRGKDGKRLKHGKCTAWGTRTKKGRK